MASRFFRASTAKPSSFACQAAPGPFEAITGRGLARVGARPGVVRLFLVLVRLDLTRLTACALASAVVQEGPSKARMHVSL